MKELRSASVAGLNAVRLIGCIVAQGAPVRSRWKQSCDIERMLRRECNWVRSSGIVGIEDCRGKAEEGDFGMRVSIP